MNSQDGLSHSTLSGTLSDLLQFTQNLQLLYQAGIPLLDAFSHFVHHENNEKKKHLFSFLHQYLNNGLPLSDAMKYFPCFFPLYYIQQLELGEMTGSFDLQLKLLIKSLSFKVELKQKIQNAIRYPLFIFSLSSLFFVFIFAFIIPQFVNVYHDFNAPLPLLTQIMLQLITFKYILSIVLIILMLPLALLFFYKNNSSFAFHCDRSFLKIPFLNILIIEHSVISWSHSWSLAYQTGLPTSVTIDQILKQLQNRLIKNDFENFKKELFQGKTIFEAFQFFQYCPAKYKLILKNGEYAGALQQSLDIIETLATQNFEKKLLNYCAYMEPLAITTLSIFIGFILISCYLPLLKLGEIII